MRLSELKTGQSATILNVLGHGGFRRRIMEMGFVRGKRVDVLQNAPLRDPIKYRIMDYEVSLRRSEAAMIVVITAEEVQQQRSLHPTMRISRRRSPRAAARSTSR